MSPCMSLDTKNGCCMQAQAAAAGAFAGADQQWVPDLHRQASWPQHNTAESALWHPAGAAADAGVSNKALASHLTGLASARSRRPSLPAPTNTCARTDPKSLCSIMSAPAIAAGASRSCWST